MLTELENMFKSQAEGISVALPFSYPVWDPLQVSSLGIVCLRGSGRWVCVAAWIKLGVEVWWVWRLLSKNKSMFSPSRHSSSRLFQICLPCGFLSTLGSRFLKRALLCQRVFTQSAAVTERRCSSWTWWPISSLSFCFLGDPWGPSQLWTQSLIWMWWVSKSHILLKCISAKYYFLK